MSHDFKKVMSRAFVADDGQLLPDFSVRRPTAPLKKTNPDSNRYREAVEAPGFEAGAAPQNDPVAAGFVKPLQHVDIILNRR
jgi:hypothetical protein